MYFVTAKKWRDARPLAVQAAALVNKAVRRGELPHVSTRRCADCGKPARQYDHRDYRKPLDVTPVCHSCNQLRGPGRPYIFLPSGNRWAKSHARIPASRPSHGHPVSTRNRFGKNT